MNAPIFSKVDTTPWNACLKKGLFALWAEGKPDVRFVETLQQSFTHARAETITFDNPITGGQSHGTVYLAKLAESTLAPLN